MNVYVPAVVGVPVIARVLLLRLNPAVAIPGCRRSMLRSLRVRLAPSYTERRFAQWEWGPLLSVEGSKPTRCWSTKKNRIAGPIHLFV